MELASRGGKTRPAKSVGFAMVMMVLGTVALADAPAFAVPPTVEAAPNYAGHIYVDLSTGTTRFNRPLVAGDVYNNPSALAAGFTSTDLLAVFGDRVTATGTGFLDQIDFSVFNSGLGTGALVTAEFTLRFYDGSLPLLPAPLGSLGVSADFGSGLNPGFYTLVTLTGLSGLGIHLTTTDLLITQTVSSFTGAATRLGVVFADPPILGTSLLPAPNTFYANATTEGPAGYYSFAPPDGNLIYRINVSATPVELSRFTVD